MSATGDMSGKGDDLQANVQVATMATVHQVQSRVDGLRSELGSVKEQVKTVDGKVTTQGNQLTTLQSSVDTLVREGKEMRGWLEGTTTPDGERREGALSRAALAGKRLGVQNYILVAIFIAIVAEVATRYLFPLHTVSAGH